MSTTSTKSLLVFSTLLILVALLGVGYELYAIQSKSQATNDLAVQAGAGAAGEKLVADLKSLQVEHAADIQALDAVALKRENLASFLDLVERTGTAVGVKSNIESVSVDQNKSASTTESRVHVTVTSDGSWPQALMYVHAIESLPYRISVDNVTLGLSNDQKSGVVWRSSITLSLTAFK